MIQRRPVALSLPALTLALVVGCTDENGTLQFDDETRKGLTAEECPEPMGTSTYCEVYEAEDRAAEVGCTFANNPPGYSGRGFMDYDGNNTSVQWDNIVAPSNGRGTLVFRYANGSAANRQAAIIVNGAALGTVPFSPTGSWRQWRTARIEASLRQGRNTIQVKANTNRGGPNLDRAVLLATVAKGTGDEENIALGKTTSQSSQAFRGDPARAVDGNTSGRWGDHSITHTDRTQRPWWRVDLGGAYQVERVVLFNRTDCCSDRLSNFDVQLLDSADRVIASTHYPGQAGSRTELNLSAAGVYAARVTLRGTNFLSLAEVQVFGRESTAGVGECAEVNEGRTVTLSCPDGQRISEIDFASYGLPTGSCETGLGRGGCHAGSSAATVRSACLDRQTCTVSANNSVFGDPCRGVPKRLGVSYTCSGADGCPDDPHKTTPGNCGCGVPEGTCGESDAFFTLGILPDVQKLTRNNELAQWLYNVGDFFIANKEEYNLLALGSVGDLVQVATLPGTRNQTRWDRVLHFASRLSAQDIHFIPSCGNHDGCQDHYGNPADYNAQFSTVRRSGGPDGNPAAYVLARQNPFFQEGYSTTNPGQGVENAYYRIDIDGRSFVVLSLRFGNSSKDGILRDTWNNWASDVLRDNSDALAIIITHWLTDSPAYLSNSERGLCEHDNVFMAIEGHSHGTRYRKIIDCGGGHRVERHQFSLPHGREERNEAAARLYTFDLAAEEVCYESRHVFENRWLREQGGCTPPCNTGSCHCDEWCIELPPPPR